MNIFKENLKELSPYSVDHVPYKVKLNANENPYGLPDKIKEEIKNVVENFEFSRYPDPMADELREVIAESYGIDKEMIMVGNGSDELINYLSIAFSGRDRVVTYPVPTFPMYRIYTILTEGKPVPIELLPDFSLPVKKLLSTRAVLTFISYPNSPTGNYFKDEDIIEIIEGSDGVVVVDEAYYEFGGKTFMRYLERYENLVILRTFSKAFSLAGMRVGYLIANPYIMNELLKVKSPYNINSLSVKIAKIVWKNYDILRPSVERIIEERERVYEILKKEFPQFRVYPGVANFLYVQTDDREDNIRKELMKRGILIRTYKDPLNDNTYSLRITIGKPEEMNLLLEALREVVSGSNMDR